MRIYHFVFAVVLTVPNSVFGQLGAEIIDVDGRKFLHFKNPCRLDDTYCPLKCSQKYKTSGEGLCVECQCQGGNGGVAHLTTPGLTTTTPSPTTTTPLATTAHFEIVVQEGKIFLKLPTPCDTSQALCSVECFVGSMTSGNTSTECQFCNCSAVTTAAPSPSTHQLSSAHITTTQPQTTTANKEVVMIGGVANLLVDFPCSPRDNICPINDCVVKGVVEDTESLCFQCECFQTTEPLVTRGTSTEPTLSVSSISAQGTTSDTLMVGGVLHFIVSNPCGSEHNLCPVEGCRVDLKTRGRGICFECNCSTTVSTKAITVPTTVTEPVSTPAGGLQTITIGGKEYTMLQNACTPKDNLCLTDVCHIEAHVAADKSVCFGCHC